MNMSVSGVTLVFNGNAAQKDLILDKIIAPEKLGIPFPAYRVIAVLGADRPFGVTYSVRPLSVVKIGGGPVGRGLRHDKSAWTDTRDGAAFVFASAINRCAVYHEAAYIGIRHGNRLAGGGIQELRD